MTENACTPYEIRFRGALDPRWAEWFDGFALIPQPNGDTLLRGVLEKIANLNFLLISVIPTNKNTSSGRVLYFWAVI